MYLLPRKRETIVLPFPAQEVYERIWKSVKPVKEGILIFDEPDQQFLFNGWVKKDKFSISLKVVRPQNFLPIIVGNIEETSTGSIIFVTYRMFPTSFAFLMFWSVITLLMAIFFGYIERYVFTGISIALGISNYAVAVANFKIQVRRSSRVLRSLFYKIDQYS